MATTVNAGARLDRLPISSFHYRIFVLIGAGMFFDGYDLYVAGGVLAATIQTNDSRKILRRPRDRLRLAATTATTIPKPSPCERKTGSTAAGPANRSVGY